MVELRRCVRSVFFVGLLGLLASHGPDHTQAIAEELITDEVTVVAPPDGTILNPGSIFDVSVSFADGSEFVGATVIAEDIGSAPAKFEPPFDFEFIVPDNIFGTKKITAVGIDASGQVLFSHSVSVEIVPSQPVVALSVSPRRLHFDYPGQQLPLAVLGELEDGSSANLTRSALTVYSSVDPGIAVVDTNGIVSAVGPGSTTVTVTHNELASEVQATVSDASGGDLDSDGDTDQDDLNVVLTFMGTATTVPNDGRDSDGNGIINAADAELFLSACGDSGCVLPDDPVSVPNLVADPIDIAKTEIAAAGLALGIILEGNSNFIPIDAVISHDPVAGTEVSFGSAVDLVVSLGPSPAIPGDLDGDGDVDFDDQQALQDRLNTTAIGPNDPMDLNADGRITGEDLAILVQSCSRRACKVE